MSRRTAVVACLMVVLVTGAAGAQDGPVTLRYKYTPGEVRHLETTSTGLLPMTIDLTNAPGEQGGLLALDMNITTTVLIDEVCKAVDEQGVASLEMTMPRITSRITQQVNNQTVDALFEWKDGVGARTVNGQPMPETEEVKQATEILRSTMKMQVAPDGKTTLDPQTVVLMGKLANANAGMGGVDMAGMNSLLAALPPGPVKVGDGWAAEQESKIMGLALKGVAALKLVAIEDLEGHRAARIEGHATINTTGAAEPPVQDTLPGQMTNITRLEMTIDFVNYLDLERGLMLCSNMNFSQNMAMVITQPGPQPGDPPIALPATIDNGQISVETRCK